MRHNQAARALSPCRPWQLKRPNRPSGYLHFIRYGAHTRAPEGARPRALREISIDPVQRAKTWRRCHRCKRIRLSSDFSPDFHPHLPEPYTYFCDWCKEDISFSWSHKLTLPDARIDQTIRAWLKEIAEPFILSGHLRCNGCGRHGPKHHLITHIGASDPLLSFMGPNPPVYCRPCYTDAKAHHAAQMAAMFHEMEKSYAQ